MGLLSKGSPLSWEDTKACANYARQQGVKQFIYQYHKSKDRKGDEFLWGDEVEFMLIKINEDNRTGKVLLKAEDVLREINEKKNEHAGIWHPEYGSFMIESIPKLPYSINGISAVESNLKKRREELKQMLGADEYALTLTSFPRLGCPDFTSPETIISPRESITRSAFFPDEAISRYIPKFIEFTRNIWERTGHIQVINVPIFHDKNTQTPFQEDFSAIDDQGKATYFSQIDNIYMEGLSFGASCCCLQVTLQTSDLDEAKILHDQLATFCPIMIALSAAGPICRGYLADVDSRWAVMTQSCDDRTSEEKKKFPRCRSRSDSIPFYLSEENNDYSLCDIFYDKDIYERLMENGIDRCLARHSAYNFTKDPLVLFSENLDQNEDDTNHLENFFSTIWNTVKLKLPPPDDTSIGWRVEFRPMDVQLTDKENAAYVVFIVLLSRIILAFKLDFIIPLSKVDENMKKAVKRDAIRKQKFYFKSHTLTATTFGSNCKSNMKQKKDGEQKFSEMTIDEIVNGKEDDAVGLIPLMKMYLETTDLDPKNLGVIEEYLSLVSKRASGELMTTSKWIREFVKGHVNYKQDSEVTEIINYDLLKQCRNISEDNLLTVFAMTHDT